MNFNQTINTAAFIYQVVLPALLEQGHTRSWLKTAVAYWSRIMSSALGLRSYLIGDVPLVQGDDGIVEGDPGIDEQVTTAEKRTDTAVNLSFPPSLFDILSATYQLEIFSRTLFPLCSSFLLPQPVSYRLSM